jgi:hypothetical protein
MDPTTLKAWEEYIEARERAAFQKGWAACLAAKMGLGGGEDQPAKTEPVATPSPQFGSMRQLPRGVPKMMVAEYMATIGGRAVAQIEIIRDIKASKGIRLKPSSVARALTALSDEGVIEEVPGTKAWRKLTKLRSVT